MPRYRVQSTTPAPVGTVWGLLIDGRSWPRWSSGLDELVEERSSDLDPRGHDDIGAVRAFRTGRVVTGERLTELVTDRRMAYEDAFNFAMKDYRAVIELEPTTAGGTSIVWHGRWRMRPGVGWLMPFVLPRVMQRMADDLAAYAAKPRHNPIEESGSLRSARQFLGRTVDLTIDRPFGSLHPTCGFLYSTNYGYVPGTLAPDGEELDAYYLGPAEPMTSARGTCVGIIHRLYDDDDKLIVVPGNSAALDDAAIAAAVEFQETAGQYIIIRP
jgi:hypothetical protein